MTIEPLTRNEKRALDLALTRLTLNRREITDEEAAAVISLRAKLLGNVAPDQGGEDFGTHD